MNINQNIADKTFTEIRQFTSGHPVFLVTTTVDVFVVKAEDSSKNKAVSFATDVMNFVDPKAATRVLNKLEIMALSRFVTANPASLIEKQPAGSWTSNIQNALRAPAAPLPGSRNPVMQHTAVWTIMEAKVNLNDMESAAAAAFGGDKSVVKLFTKALNSGGNLKRLGMILAADAFNGNNDRLAFIINMGGRVGKQLEFSGVKLKQINNPGNLFIADEKKRMTVLGLDAFDPNNAISRYPETFSAEDYSGLFLRADKAGDRNTLLTQVAEDIEVLLGPRNRKFSFLQQTRLPANAVQQMEQGMVEGADKILAFLKVKFANGNMGLPMTQRLKSIGWLTRANFPRI